jgi:hypothetical protein
LVRRRCHEADPIDVPAAVGDVAEPLQARSRTTALARSKRFLLPVAEQVGEERRLDSLEGA